MNDIHDSVNCYCNDMSKLGFSTKHISITSAILSKLIQVHESQGCTTLKLDIAQSYIDNVHEMLDSDRIGHYLAQQHIYTVKKFMEFCNTGKIDADRPILPKTPLTPLYDSVIDEYINEVAETTQQRKSRAWAPKRYAKWLLQHNISQFGDATVYDLRQYLLDDMQNLKSKSIPNLRAELRHFNKWLFEHGFISNSLEELFDFRVAIESKIHPAPIPDDVARVIAEIDCNTQTGKRDYAVILMGVVLGLRGCDIIKLKFTDIDWHQGEIRISQNKTGKPLALPLTTDVAKAIQDYIFNGRPQSNSDCIFLRKIPPFVPLKSGGQFGNMYTSYMKKAGVKGEGGFYSLRRALGRNMVVSGTPVTTVAQVLGHTDISNTKQYIALDTHHLKICALDFSGILPKRWLK